VQAPYGTGNADVAQPVLLPIGENLVVLRADDGNDGAYAEMTVKVVRGIEVNATTQFPIQPPATYVFPTISQAFFELADPLSTPTVSVTLNGAGKGLVALGIRDDAANPVVPDGYQLGSPPYYYDFLTTGPFTSATVCFDLMGQSFAAP